MTVSPMYTNVPGSTVVDNRRQKLQIPGIILVYVVCLTLLSLLLLHYPIQVYCPAYFMTLNHSDVKINSPQPL